MPNGDFHDNRPLSQRIKEDLEDRVVRLEEERSKLQIRNDELSVENEALKATILALGGKGE